jgi:G6PDH family F420-dependent oxidoreductase
MLKLGYKLMSEEHGGSDLVRNAMRAEDTGFDFAAISDHFAPWLAEQGHAPLAWPVLGAVAHATRSIGLMTAATCPTMRYHPAIVAQGAATLSELSNNRFTLGLGAGERLNEHITGAGWPGTAERHERLSKAVDIIQGRWGAIWSTTGANTSGWIMRDCLIDLTPSLLWRWPPAASRRPASRGRRGTRWSRRSRGPT